MSVRPGELVLDPSEVEQMEAVSTVVKRRREGKELEHRHRAQSIIQQQALDELETEVFQTGLYENIDVHRGSCYSVLAADIAFSYLWWSVVNGLVPLVWFFPLCAMEISGYEALAVFWLSPLLFLLRPMRQAFTTPLGLLLLRLLMIVGVASFQVHTLLTRLVVLAVGNFFAFLVLPASLWGLSRLDRHRRVYGLLLGYLLALALRSWGTSFNPVFFSFTFNSIAIAAGAFLSIFLYFNDCRSPIVDSSEPGRERGSFPGLVATGVSFGAILFLLQLLFGDVSVLSHYASAAYPDRGPYPYPWGLLTMLALTVGLVVFSHQRDLLGSPGWLLVGLLSSMVLYFLNSYVAFFAGLALAVFTASLLPHLTKRLLYFHPGKVLPIAVLAYTILILLSVWVVAYNFVPGGVITRERSDVLLAATVLMIGWGARNPLSSAKEKEEVPEMAGKERKRGGLVRKLSTIAEESGEEEWDCGSSGSVHEERVKDVLLEEEKECRTFQHRITTAAVAIFLFTLLSFAYRYQPPISLPDKEHPDTFSAGIWAFHFGYDNNAYPSMERAAQFIQDADLDVVGLLETDAARPYIGNHDIASWLGERLNMHVDYGPGSKYHTWGALALSKYPILQSQHFLLPSPDGEIAPAILMTVNMSGHLVNFYIVHFGNDVDELDRKLQAETTADILSNSTHPVVMLSYITNPPGSRDYLTVVEQGRVKDIDNTDRKRWCEYVFYRGVIRLGYARVSHGGLSDTELQIGKFRLPGSPDEEDNSVLITAPEKVPQWIHFPKKFGSRHTGHWYDQSRHHYHMGTPKYFTQ